VAAELTRHAREEMQRRAIPMATVEAILRAPMQKTPELGDVVCYQSQVEISDRLYLVRVMVNERTGKVVTVYRTSKIGKYWRETP